VTTRSASASTRLAQQNDPSVVVPPVFLVAVVDLEAGLAVGIDRIVVVTEILAKAPDWFLAKVGDWVQFDYGGEDTIGQVIS
jgi:hypothetical protein